MVQYGDGDNIWFTLVNFILIYFSEHYSDLL